MLRVLRTSRATDSASSSDFTCRLAMALLIPRKSAALVYEPKSTTARNVCARWSSVCMAVLVGVIVQSRSEEHTSELQSQSNLVCRLLLEKKNGNSWNGVGR